MGKGRNNSSSNKIIINNYLKGAISGSRQEKCETYYSCLKDKLEFKFFSSPELEDLKTFILTTKITKVQRLRLFYLWKADMLHQVHSLDE